MTPKREAYSEPKIDRKGRIMLEELDDNNEHVWKFQHQLTNKDTPVYEDKKVGDLIVFALDKTDDKADGTTIRQRFSLSCKVEDALQNGGYLEVEIKDIRLIEGTLEAIKNPLFNYRIQEVLDSAEPVKNE